MSARPSRAERESRGQPSSPLALAWGITAALVGVTLLVYWQVRSFQFVSYDDPFFVNGNAHVLEGLTWSSVQWAFSSTEAFWHPLTWLTHILDAQFYGSEPGGHHLTNLFWHLAGVVVLFWAWFRLTHALWPSALVAALFALHPLHAESVAWISERKGVLSSFFWMAALWAYAGYVRTATTSNTRWGGLIAAAKYVLVTLFFTMGLMSKPTLVTLPCVLLLLDYWPLGRLRLGGGELSPAWGAPCPPRKWRWLVLEKAPWAGIVIWASVVAVGAEEEHGALGWLPDLTFTSQLANAAIVYILYLVKFVLPIDLMFFYRHPGNEVSLLGAAAAAATILAVLGLAVWQARRRPYLLVGWLWYLGVLVPVIGLVQVGGHRMADRYTDIPLIGIGVMLSWGLAELVRRAPGARATVIAVTSAALLLLSLISWNQAGVWSNSATLYQHALEVDPRNWVALSNYGLLLDRLNQHELAMEIHRRAVAAKPDSPVAHNNLANALLRKNEAAEAIQILEATVKAHPEYHLAQASLGVAYSAVGRNAEADRQFRIALESDPDALEVRRRYALFLAKAGRVDDAVEQYRELRARIPNSRVDEFNYSLMLMNNRRYPAAFEAFTEFVDRWPDDAEAHAGRARSALESGRIGDAVLSYRRALELKPELLTAQLGYSWLLSTSSDPQFRDGTLAFRLAEKACAATAFKNVQGLDTLAAACAEIGRFDRAAELADRAYQAATSLGDSQFANAIQQRLELYRKRQPYRQPPPAAG